MNDENSLNLGFFTILLVIGVGLVPFGIGIFIILYAFGYLFHSLFEKKQTKFRSGAMVAQRTVNARVLHLSRSCGANFSLDREHDLR